MIEARQGEIPYPDADPGKRDGSLRPIAPIPHTGMRFSPIVSIRAGVFGDGQGKFSRMAARLDGKKIEEREETRSSFSGDDLVCDDIF